MCPFVSESTLRLNQCLLLIFGPRIFVDGLSRVRAKEEQKTENQRFLTSREQAEKSYRIEAVVPALATLLAESAELASELRPGLLAVRSHVHDDGLVLVLLPSTFRHVGVERLPIAILTLHRRAVIATRRSCACKRDTTRSTIARATRETREIFGFFLLRAGRKMRSVSYRPSKSFAIKCHALLPCFWMLPRSSASSCTAQRHDEKPTRTPKTPMCQKKKKNATRRRQCDRREPQA